MNGLTLRELEPHDEQAFLAGYNDWKDDDLSWYTFAWKPGMSHQEHLQILKDQKDKTKIPKNRVPGTMLYGFVHGEIIGRFNIRHELNPHLLERGGNVGYAVAARHRKKGYASEMFRLGKAYCKQLSLQKILITCADQNIASWKIIEKFGGQLENKIFDSEEKEWIRRYWMQL